MIKGCEKFHKCRKCEKETADCELVEDNQGHEDVKYTCTNPDCKFVWWVDGSDY